MSKIICVDKTYDGRLTDIFMEIIEETEEKLDIKFAKYAIKSYNIPSSVIIDVINEYYADIVSSEISDDDLTINKSCSKHLTDFRMEMFVYLFSSCKDLLEVINKASKNDFIIKAVSKIKKIDFILENKYEVNVNYEYDSVYVRRIK